ncbi:hypothetical protein BN1723_000812 [Verticillium longisporum]|uniref:Uncharacterized protein n=1 Tax=Verticillium longisporum TaxID=100787 RepID=A0A0G4N7I6_VERLO|nr:hypothetical protein BN1723_000812 [Verticillium longisporum]
MSSSAVLELGLDSSVEMWDDNHPLPPPLRKGKECRARTGDTLLEAAPQIRRTSGAPRSRPAGFGGPALGSNGPPPSAYRASNAEAMRAGLTLVSETPTPAAAAAPLNSRWLSDLQARIRRIASVESRSGRHEEARQLLRLTETQWLGFLAGRDGFLTGHVNNVMYNKFAESARVNWILSHGKRDGPEAAKEWAEIMSPRGVGLILKSIKTDFKFPMAYPDQVTAVYKLAEKPTYASDHLKLDGLLLSEQHRRWLGFLAGRDGFLTGHVNNVMYNKFAESARVNWILSHGKRDGPEAAKEWAEIMSPRGVGLILKSIKTDFKFPMAYPDQVTVVYKLAEKPTYTSDHLKLDALLLSEQHRRVAARCIEEVTIYDYRAAKKAVLPPHMVDRLAETFELQEEARREFDERANGVIKAIQEIEAKE